MALVRSSYQFKTRLFSIPAVSLSTSTKSCAFERFRLVVVGGGTGGCSVAAKFARSLPKGSIAILEPHDTHYYQPMWTLVGGGMKSLSQSARPMSSVLPSQAKWFKESVVAFNPEKNLVITNAGTEIQYEYLVVAMGLSLRYERIKGLPEAFETPGVCSNYSSLYVDKTYKALQAFKEGNAIFTMPSTPVKCAGAPQKAMYIAEDYLRKNGKRDKATVLYNSALGVLFGVPKYAEALSQVVKERGIKVNLKHELIEVKPDTKEAVFKLLDKPGETSTFKYEMLHVTPPMTPPDVLMQNKQLANEAGFLNVNKNTLQHVTYRNVFGIGDCTSLPTSRTAAAAAAQCGILYDNLSKVMVGKELKAVYDGYTSCPLVTGYSKCILAEFDYDGKPLETFPFDQGKERRTMFHMKKDMMPTLYWTMMLKGWWNGPGILRRILHLGSGR